MPERIDLAHAFGKKPLRRWRAGTLNGHDERYVAVGLLADGRAYAWHSEIDGGAFVYGTEREADALAAGWRSDGRKWHPIPASFDSQGQPADGGQGRPHGQTWLPADPV